MCGIAGILDVDASAAEEDLRCEVARMSATLAHRGPDDDGTWVDAPAGIALGFRRLSIIDVSPAGHQPMVSASGRYVIVFNGEVYNFEEIRRELVAGGRAPAFRGHSDTEVMLASLDAWGLEASLHRFVGMFAFALWDRTERTLSLVRDRVGVKPLYYAWTHHALLFASELKALTAHPRFDRTIDRDAVALFLRYGYVPAPCSIYASARKVLPGTVLRIGATRSSPTSSVYWSAREIAERGIAEPFTGHEQEAIAELDRTIEDAVRLRMIADVPLGVWLSGGIDSSMVASAMQRSSARPIKTFTVGVSDRRHDEAADARQIARHLGTDHTDVYVTPAEARDVVPLLPRLFDEPFADASQIPTCLVAALARRHVTVCLSGDGGDELFGGYDRYRWGRAIWKGSRWLPHVLRSMPARLTEGRPIGRFAKVAAMVASETGPELYERLVSFRIDSSRVVSGSRPGTTAFNDARQWAALPDVVDQMMYLDLLTYLPDDILVKVDRASMGVSLEVRQPLLDHRLVEFAWRLPRSMKVRRGRGKWILREALARHLPRSVVDRPKKGFEIPVGDWLRGPLREWAEALLADEAIRAEGYFDAKPIRRMWTEHTAGRANWDKPLWAILMFRAWSVDAC
jgi:asparagine synthase (glutamine-hydrolysing)